MPIRKRLLIISIAGLLQTGVGGGCSSLSPSSANQDSSTDNSNPSYFQSTGRLGDDEPPFDPDAFMHGFSGSPGR